MSQPRDATELKG